MDRRILVVDDDPAMLKLLSKYLQAGNYEVLTACNGEEALNILHREGASIVLSDWGMPKMDGLELCRAIRASEGIGFVYVIILTAHSDKDSVVEALESGANDFLSKPFRRQELLARINAGMRVIGLEADLMRERREMHKVNAELAILNRKLELMATTDELTELVNRREGMRQLRNVWDLSVRTSRPMSCIMMDLDLFKNYNDTYGHEVGDLLLRRTAEVMKETARSGDVVCRIGGEEFMIVCANLDGPAAVQLAERYRLAIAAARMETADLDLGVTISAGVATRDESITNCEDLLKYADQALYRAKHSGRNRVVMFEPASTENAADPVAVAI